MWKQIALVAVVGCLSVPAEAKIYSLTFTPSANQVPRYDNGIRAIDSYQSATSVRLREVIGNDKKTVSFLIGIRNTGSQPFNFGPENIVVRPVGMQPLQPFIYQDAMTTEQKQEKHGSFWTGLRKGMVVLGNSMAANSAGTTYGSGTYSGCNMYGNCGMGTYTYTAQDPAAQAAAQRYYNQKTQQELAQLDANERAKRDSHSSSYGYLLRTSIVDPTKVYTGEVSFVVGDEVRHAGAPVDVVVEVSVNGEKHNFVGHLSGSD